MKIIAMAGGEVLLFHPCLFHRWRKSIASESQRRLIRFQKSLARQCQVPQQGTLDLQVIQETEIEALIGNLTGPATAVMTQATNAESHLETQDLLYRDVIQGILNPLEGLIQGVEGI